MFSINVTSKIIKMSRFDPYSRCSFKWQLNQNITKFSEVFRCFYIIFNPSRKTMKCNDEVYVSALCIANCNAWRRFCKLHLYKLYTIFSYIANTIADLAVLVHLAGIYRDLSMENLK